MLEATLISVITPVYNYEKYLAETIQSVIDQSYNNWELIIVDDNSTDNSADIAKSFVDQDKRIKLYRLTDNRGVAFARNKALQQVTGNFVAFLDSDDVWYPRKLEMQIDFMLKNGYEISFTSYEIINDRGVSLHHVIGAPRVVDLKYYLKNTIIGFSTSMIDISKTGDIRFMELPSRVDTQLWITLLKKGFRAYGLENVLTKYRVAHSSVSSNKWKAAYQVWKLYYKVEKLGFFHSLIYFLFYAYNALKKRIISS